MANGCMVNIGIGSDVGAGDSSKIAKEAFVFLITAINASWKIPVGYFLVDGLSGEQKSALVLQCLELLHSTGIEVISMTFDGCPANIAMAKKLGCSLEVHNMVTNFKHPVTGKPVSIFLDACHMIKLVRNSFESSGTFKDCNGNQVKWSHLVKLNNLQEKEHLHLANKLKRGHLFFKNQKMKVRLATQLMSNSIADALKFCCQLNHIEFSDVDGTVTFLKSLNNLFDVLNSWNMNQNYFKKPLYFRNKENIFNFLGEVEDYLKTLKLDDGQYVIKTNKKTGFIGLLTCIHSLKEIYIRVIEDEKKLQYLPGYKFSQDHLELTFGHIRAHGGCNNNPTARQFMSIYKKLIAHIELKDFDSGNCVALENLSILSCSSAIQKINITTMTPLCNYEPEEDMNNQSYFDEMLSNYDIDISEFRQQVVTYIAGSVAHYLLKKKCDTCVSALLGSDKNDDHVDFIKLKDNGGLIIPSADVITICLKAETILKKLFLDGKMVKMQTLKDHFLARAMSHFVAKNIFADIQYHQYDQSPLDNHIVQLIKCVLERYMDIRLNYFAKNAIQKVKKRQFLNKFLHFTGQ
ncbi:unnamed protein product [Parnassius mnemosyne]|uniref:THAP domain-containing protein 9 n=1 Tax=Parnassius mnemosyne TaxID=213953 RepID=A0AAV1L812_9NEOP